MARTLPAARTDRPPEAVVASIVLVEDHALLAEVLREELASYDLAVRLVSPAPDVLDRLAGVGEADLVLLDHDLGDDLPTGADLIEPLVGRGIRVAMLTGVTDPATLGRCLRAGAIGVIPKTESFVVLVDQIRAALDGRPIGPSPPKRSEYLDAARATDADQMRRSTQLDQLTAREQAVLRALVEGQTIAEIADSSFVAVSTVRSQVKSLRRKLGVNTQVQAVAMAAEAGWFAA